MNPLELDDRWDWIEVVDLGSAGPDYVRGRCRHRDVEDVRTFDGELVAQLCVTCDLQLPV